MAPSITGEVRIYADHESLCRAGAEGLVRFANRTLEEKDHFSIALSGGRTPRRLYEILASDYIDQVEWKKAHLYWCDERYVSQRDRSSNFRMFHETLLYHVHIPLGSIHPMPTHRKKAADAARDYERYMRTEFDGKWPRIDVILLGVGEGGETASIFPGSPAIADTVRWVMEVDAREKPSKRLTFTLPVLNAAGAVCFVASGERKAAVIRRILTEPVDAEACPAGAVRPAAGRLIWWVDEAAFSQVDESLVREFDIRRHSV